MDPLISITLEKTFQGFASRNCHCPTAMLCFHFLTVKWLQLLALKTLISLSLVRPLDCRCREEMIPGWGAEGGDPQHYTPTTRFKGFLLCRTDQLCCKQRKGQRFTALYQWFSIGVHVPPRKDWKWACISKEYCCFSAILWMYTLK